MLLTALTRVTTCTNSMTNRNPVTTEFLKDALRAHSSRFARSAMVAVTQTTHSEDVPLPPRKRARIEPAANSGAKEPRLFAPFRALGLITNHVPFVLQTRSYKGATSGPTLHLVTCLGKAWAMWEGGKMTLQFVGT